LQSNFTSNRHWEATVPDSVPGTVCIPPNTFQLRDNNDWDFSLKIKDTADIEESCNRFAYVFDITSLQGALVIDVQSMFYTWNNAFPRDLRGCDYFSIETEPQTWATALAGWDDMRDGILYVNNGTDCNDVTEIKTVTLPSTAFSDFEDNLSLGWWALSQVHNNETRDPVNDLRINYDENAPTLTVNYNILLNLTTVDFNQTNPETVDIFFTETILNTTATTLAVNYPGAANLTCVFDYRFAQVNTTHTGLVSSPTTFTFLDASDDVIHAVCTDINTNTTALYVITQSTFPLVDNINLFREGNFGTEGFLGAFDIIGLMGVVIAMIALNRFNESVGVIVSIMLIGVLWWFGIVTFPSVIVAALAIIVMVTIASTRKVG